MMVDQAARDFRLDADPVDGGFGIAVAGDAAHRRVDDRLLTHSRHFANTASARRDGFLTDDLFHSMAFQSRYAADYM
jgi:hypothetical protein